MSCQPYEDVVLFVSDPSKDFCFTSLAVPSAGYLYFQLKSPKVLAETMLWMSNGGRHYPPWNGRVSSVIGLEEITGYFYYGRAKSVAENPLLREGYPTFLDAAPGKPLVVGLVVGVVPIPPDFRGVEDIVRKDDSTLLVLGKTGEKIEVPCQTGFLGECVA